MTDAQPKSGGATATKRMSVKERHALHKRWDQSLASTLTAGATS